MRIREVLPGVFHWTAKHPAIGIDVSCHYVARIGLLLDPLLPDEGLEWFERRGPPAHVLLTNRLHSRHSARFVERFGCEVWCNREGLHHFGEGGEIEDLRVRGFRPGDGVPPGTEGSLESYEVGVLCPDETAFRIPGPEPALVVADGIVRDGDGPLAFVPDAPLGDDPEAVKRGLKAAYRRLLDLEFEHVLLAHGRPWLGGAREAVSDFVAR